MWVCLIGSLANLMVDHPLPHHCHNLAGMPHFQAHPKIILAAIYLIPY